MKMIFKKATARYPFEYYADGFKEISSCYYFLEENTAYEIEEISSPVGNYKYEIIKKYEFETLHFLMTETTFNEYFRLPIKSHLQIKLLDNENECNEFLEGLEPDCLKDIKFTENQIMVVYLIKGD